MPPPPSRNAIKKPSIPIQAKNSLVNKFSKALLNPFSPEAMGSRVPDLFSFPTATYHCHGTTVLGGVGFAVGTGSVMFMPNPLASMVDLRAVQGNAYAPLSSSGSTSATTMGSYRSATAVNSAIYGAALTNASGTSTTNVLSTVLADYRVVSWGIKVSSLQAELSAVGRLIVALVPIGDEGPGFNNLLSTQLDSQNGADWWLGAAVSTMSTSAILNLPSGFELAVQDLLHGDLEIAGTYVSPQYFNFRNTADSYNWSATRTSGDFTVQTTSAGTTNSTGNKDPLRMSGGCGIVLYWEGCPSAVPLFQVEYIYHLEGNPNISANPTACVPSNGTATLLGSTSALEAGMSAVAGMKSVQWIARGADFLNKAARSPLVGALAGLVM